jgi:chromosome segregation ATPase
VPGKTNTESIRDLEKLAATLEVQVQYLREDLATARAVHARTAENAREIDKRLVVLENKFADLKTALDEKDKRRAQLFLLFLGSALTLVVNVILLFIGKK